MHVRTILSVDDSSDDSMLLRLACSAAKVGFQLQIVDRGESAIAYLEGAGDFADRVRFPLPCLLLLDLKMPGKSGFDVLGWVRNSGPFESLPVVIFTSSVHSEDRRRALQLGANGFVVKPVGYEALQSLVHAIDALLSSPCSPDFHALECFTEAPAVSAATTAPRLL